MTEQEALLEFKGLKITKEELSQKIGEDSFRKSYNTPVEVNTDDVIRLLHGYQMGDIDTKRLLSWVNTVWFTDLFTYKDDQCDSIASVMNKLEELDERGYILSENEIKDYIQALSLNMEI
jgi:hypothetical protein